MLNPNNGLFRTLSRLVDVAGLSLLWLLCCVPVVTIGPAAAALYRTVTAVFFEGDDVVFRRYFRCFRENLRVGIPAGVIAAAAGVALLLGYVVMLGNRSSPAGSMMYAVYCVAMVLPLGMGCWLFPLLGRFTFSLGGLFRTALQMSLMHLPTTLAVGAVTAGSLALLRQAPWTVLFVPVVMSLGTALLLERVFKQHLS